jgi:hypothetical protein
LLVPGAAVTVAVRGAVDLRLVSSKFVLGSWNGIYSTLAFKKRLGLAVIAEFAVANPEGSVSARRDDDAQRRESVNASELAPGAGRSLSRRPTTASDLRQEDLRRHLANKELALQQNKFNKRCNEAISNVTV